MAGKQTGKPKAPGIRVRSTKPKPVATKLYDRETGEWIATARWRPCGEMYFELANHVGKSVVRDST
jgi:hypothetical protein